MKKNNLKNTLFRLWKFLDLYKGKIVLVIILNIIGVCYNDIIVGIVYGGKK